ncbi:DUF4011 domain-containing protein [Saccharibacillus qingshengii]|uniref:DUF4011 domain-containing protein n=1 Tax=Saccharibacillus qingshengii TaxID=1763540 RepID=UPI0015537091|nr:DUF4011 domain-containing protein [Saccharibacillus qingshengii]
MNTAEGKQKMDKKIEKWKSDLIDISGRNPLLNFKPKKTNSLRLSENLSWLAEQLLDEQYLNLEELETPFLEEVRRLQSKSYEITSAESDKMNPAQRRKHQEDWERNIQGRINEQHNELKKALTKLRNSARTAMNEQGINIAYLTFGLLKWKPGTGTNSTQTSSAPLLLLPVMIKKTSANSPFTLNIYEQEIIVNPFINHVLEEQFGLTLSDLTFEADNPDFTDIFEQVYDKIENLQDWTVEEDCYLSLFSFNKLVMYKDLEQYRDLLESHPLIREIVGTAGEDTIRQNFDAGLIPSESRMDKEVPAEQNFNVVDADSSQQRAIIAAKKGMSFVLQGPPGTGKSQTITNIVAECLAAGKKVLFVSEKMAALNVVKDRLEERGLSEFCLEMHSHKAGKRQVLDSLADTINKPAAAKKVPEEIYQQMNYLRDRLNTYSEKLHEVRQPYGKSVYEVQGLLNPLKDIPEILSAVHLSADQNLEEIYRLLADLDRYRNQTSQADSQPWEALSAGRFSFELQANVQKLLQHTADVTRNALALAETLSAETELQVSRTEELDRIVSVLELAAVSPRPPQAWLTSLDVSELIREAREHQEQVGEFFARRGELLQSFDEQILELPVQDLQETLFGDSDFLDQVPEKERLKVLDDQGEKIQQAAEDFGRVREQLRLFDETVKATGQQVSSLNDYRRLSRYMKLFNLKVQPSFAWFVRSSWKTAIQQAHLAKSDHERMSEMRQQLLAAYETSFIGQDAGTLIKQINESTTGVQIFASPDHSLLQETLYDNSTQILTALEELFGWYKQWGEIKIEFEELFQLELTQTSDVQRLSRIMELVAVNPQPERGWFDSSHSRKVRQELENAKELLGKFEKDRKKLQVVYVDELLDEPGLEERIEQVHNRCLNEYQSPVKRALGGGYRKDVRWLSAQRKEAGKVDFQAFLKDIRAIRRTLNYRSELKKQESHWAALMGRHYLGLRSDWSAIEDSIATTEKIVDWHQGKPVSSALQELLVAPSGRTEELLSRHRQLKRNSEALIRCLLGLKTAFPQIWNASLAPELESWNLDQMISRLLEDSGKIQSLVSRIKPIVDFRIGYGEPRYRELMEDLFRLQSLRELQNSLKDKEAYYRHTFGKAFQGEDTPWEDLQEALEEIGRLHAENITIPTQIAQFAIDNTDDYRDRQKSLEQHVHTLERSIQTLDAEIPTVIQDEEGIHANDRSLTWISEHLNEFVGGMQRWRTAYLSIRSTAKRPFADFAELRAKLELASQAQQRESALEHQMERLQQMFGSRIQGFSTDWPLIFDALAWTEEWKGLLGEDAALNPLLQLVCAEGTENKPLLQGLIENAQQSKMALTDMTSRFSVQFDLSAAFAGRSEAELTWEMLNGYANSRLPHLDRMESWIRYRNLQKQAYESGLGDFVDQAMSESGEYSLKDLFQKRLFKQWLDRVYEQEDLLAEFDAHQAGEDLKQFRKLDSGSQNLNVIRIKEKLESEREHALSAPAFLREKQLVLHEIGKKKRHIPIRQLMQGAADFVQSLKPCFLMSPLSVSQYIDAHKIKFDLVIFDEASQIFSEDAIGAMIRGKQVIIVGDTKQLPPTNFFQSSGIEEDYDTDEEQEEEVNYESILDECANILPPLDLRWHYRSKHESLITFSNEAFYYNNLITFPSADNGSYLGTDFVHVQDGIYDRGSSSTNRPEARRVAELVFEHYRDHGHQSLGVIAFSQKQAAAIEEELQIMRRQQPEFEQYFQEGSREEFFVKSLENVQGDERDVIFLSVGYGRAADGSIYYNFGPLSKAKGERRLNVAVTRAKYHMKLVSSITPDDLPEAKVEANSGLKHLKQYMQNVMYGYQPMIRGEGGIPKFDSPFEEDVYRVLTDMGYTVDTQVGCSGYRIDLGIVDPDDKTKYLIGIECDGANYHSSKVARDRDRLRQQVLEGLGWKIYRIWSQEWFKNRRHEVERLKLYLEEETKREIYLGI